MGIHKLELMFSVVLKWMLSECPKMSLELYTNIYAGKCHFTFNMHSSYTQWGKR